MCVVDGLLECHRTVGAEQLVIRSLRLYGRNNVAQCVDQAAVEGYDALSGSTQRFAVQHHVASRNMLRDVLQSSVQAGYGRVALFLDLFY